MAERSGDWLRQSLRDLESARAQERDGFYEWSCFIAQQAAEKALEALFQRLGAEAWGHSVLGLLQGLKGREAVPRELEDSSRYLDRYYIPSRYPNGWAAGTPGEYITRKEASDAIGHSQAIVGFCRDFLAGPGAAAAEGL